MRVAVRVLCVNRFVMAAGKFTVFYTRLQASKAAHKTKLAANLADKSVWEKVGQQRAGAAAIEGDGLVDAGA